MKLLHAALVCENRENADRFYEDLLGLKKISTKAASAELMHRLFGVDSPYTLVLYGNAHLSVEVFIGPCPEKPQAGVTHLCLDVGPLAPFLEKCGQMEVPVLRMPKPDGTDLIFITDFDGNRFEIKGD